MASKVSNDAFKLIFPRYAELLSQQSAPVNQSIEVFLREELPRKVEMVRSMQTCFNAFLTHFTNLILKRPQHSHLIHSLTLKANDKTQKYFHSLSLSAHKLDSNSIRDRIPSINIQGLKREFKSKLQSINQLLKEKYFCGGILTRQCEEQVAMRIYVLMEIYYFFKNDPVAMAVKFKIKEEDVLWAITRNQEPTDISSLITLDPNFINSIEETVLKRCRPFVNRRELLDSKVRETLREGQSKVGPNLNLLIQSLISKERGRIGRQLSNSLGSELKTLEQGQEEAQVKDLINQSENLKRQFAQLKNTTYFLDIMRGNFSEKYKMQVHRLENVFYLTNLQKYLQDVSTFLEKVLSLEEKIIKNRKDYMKDFGSRVESKITDLISFYQSKPSGQGLSDVILQQFDQLESALYGVVNKQPVESVEDYKKKQQRQRREAQKKYQLERKAQQERQRREQQKLRLQQKRRKQEERTRQARIQRQQKDRQRREQANRQQQERRLEMQRKREQKNRKDQQARRQRDDQLRRKDQQRRNRQAEQKNKREQMNRKKAQQQQRKRSQKQQQTRKRQLQRKNILQREQQQKKRRQAELKQKKDRQQQERNRRQNQRKSQEQRLKRQKQQRQADQRRKDQQRIKGQKQRKQRQQRQAEDRRRQEERLRNEKQQRQREQRQGDQKRRQQQKKQRQKRQQQQKQRRQRQKRQRQTDQLRRQQEKRNQQQRIKSQKQRQQKQMKYQRQRQRKNEQQRIARQRQQKKRKQQQQRVRIQKQKEQRQERQRLEREKSQKQRQQKQRVQKERKQKQRLDKQKQQKQRQQRERLEKQRVQKQKQQKQRRQKQVKQAEQKRKQQQRQKMQKQKKEKERKEAQQKARIQKQKKQRQENQKRAQMQRLRKIQEEAKTKNKGKPEPKKSSGINYGDFDDILDDDLQEMQKAGKKLPSGINSKVNQDEYGDDFDEQSPHKEDQISTKQLISQADIKCLNDYMKGTTYARKNKVNAELLNKPSKYLQVFQELIQNRKLFIFDSAISKAVIDLGTQIQNPDTPQDDLRMSIQTIFDEMKRVYQQMFQGEQQMYPMTRYIFPFSFKNQFNIKLLQMIPHHTYFKVVLDEPLPQDEQTAQKFQCLIEGLLHTFQLQGEPNLEEYVVNEQSKLVLDTFDRELPCLLLLFALHYERSATKDILINQYTIQRFFYTSNIIEPLYDTIKDQEQISQHFNQIHEKYSTNDKIKIHNITVSSSDQDYQQQLTHSSLAIKQEFKKSKHTSCLNCFAVQIEEQGQLIDKITVYMSLDKASPKIAVNYFLVSKDPEEQENAATIFQLISQGDKDFEVNVYTDFTRHNGLSSYSDWSLPLWAHCITKRKLSSLQAFRAITFAMTPFYLSFKQMD